MQEKLLTIEENREEDSDEGKREERDDKRKKEYVVDILVSDKFKSLRRNMCTQFGEDSGIFRAYRVF